MTCSIRFFGQDYGNPRVKDFDTCELAFEVSTRDPRIVQSLKYGYICA